MCILSRRPLSMSLPASLTTDCGGLLNRRGPGRKRCCHTGLFTWDIMLFSSHGLFLSRIIELVYFHTEHHGESRFYCPEFANCRIFHHTESHGESRDLCHELSNYRISFLTEDYGGFLCHETCSWSRICETCPLDPLTNGK